MFDREETTETETEGRYDYLDDECTPGVRVKGKEGRRLGSYTDLMAFRDRAGNGARKRLGA